MFQSPILDVATGLVLVFLVVALVCTSINEYIAQALSLRSQVLFKAVCSLFQNCSNPELIAKSIFNHDLVDALSPAGTNPSYIPSQLFSLALVDNLGLHTPATVATDPVTSVKDLLDKAKKANDALEKGNLAKIDARVYQTLAPLAVAAGNSIDTFRKNIESWFDSAMQRAGGWYKKKIQIITFFVAISVCLVFNVDALMISNSIWSNPAARSQLDASAAAVTKPAIQGADTPGSPSPGATAPSPTSPAVVQARSNVMTLVGWSGPILSSMSGYTPTDAHRFPNGFGEWMGKLIGLFITAFAACLGAPFWFGVLNKIISIRGTGASPSDPKVVQPARIGSGTNS